MSVSRKKLGAAGEELAAHFLLRQGYQILARNLKLRYGEVDILALEGNALVIVEVKAKSSHAYGVPAEMITPTKRRKLCQLALLLAKHYNKIDYRIDVVAIDGSVQPPHIQHFRNIS